MAVAGDHDFKIVSLTPSVTLRADVKPVEGEDCTSYYRGAQNIFLGVFMLLVTCYVFKILCYFVIPFNICEANLTITDSRFQKSSSIRHVAELFTTNKKIGQKSEAFVMVFTDGGPDHNISFLNVLISWLAYFFIGGCDSLVVGRTTHTQI
jgi:hypothetical protein